MTLLESRDEVDKIIKVITENINEEGEEEWFLELKLEMLLE
jgi:hypothetical protein